MVLDPSTSAVIVFGETATPSQVGGQAHRPLLRLMEAAKLPPVPIFAAVYRNGLGLSVPFTPSMQTEPSAVYEHDAAAADWSVTKLGRAVASTGRPQLIICGHWLEEAVTIAALRALAVGYDTYLPVDAALAHEPALASVAHMRLAHAGVVLTSSGQIVREWAALSGSISTSDALLDVLA